MLDDKIFELEPKEIMALSIESYSNEDVFNLSYYIWACFSDCNELMIWRKERLIPRLPVLGEYEETD